MAYPLKRPRAYLLPPTQGPPEGFRNPAQSTPEPHALGGVLISALSHRALGGVGSGQQTRRSASVPLISHPYWLSGGDSCAVERAANALHCPGIDSKTPVRTRRKRPSSERSPCLRASWCRGPVGAGISRSSARELGQEADQILQAVTQPV